MFKRQDLTRPQLQELGPPRMEGQFPGEFTARILENNVRENIG